MTWITDSNGTRWVECSPRPRRGPDRNGRFRDVKVGDQLEKPLKRALAGSYSIRMGVKQTAMERDGRNPEMVAAVRIVSHIWHDPVEGREYVALAAVLADGTLAQPREKHTRRGLATNGWFYAETDWLALAKARATASNVEPLRAVKGKSRDPGRPL